MKYKGERLNIIQEEKIINAFFDDAFQEGVQGELDSFIAKKMEDTDNDFLMYDETEMEQAIKYHEKALRIIKNLQARDFSGAKFKDSYYIEKR